METIKRTIWLSLIVLGVLLLTSSALAALPSEGPAPQPPAPPQDVQLAQVDTHSTLRLDAKKIAEQHDQAIAQRQELGSGDRLPQAAGPKAMPARIDPLSSNALQLNALTPNAAHITCQSSEEPGQIIHNGDFEQISDWYSYGFGPTGTLEPDYDFSVAHQGNRSVVITGTPGGEFWVWQEIEFPARINQAELSFYLNRDNIDPDDAAFVVFYDNSGIDMLGWISYTTQTTDWQLVQINLDALLGTLAGRKSLVNFGFVTGEDSATTIFHMDDIKLELCMPNPPCKETVVNGNFEGGDPTDSWEIEGTAYLDDVNYHSLSYGLGIGGNPPVNPAHHRPGLPLQGSALTKASAFASADWRANASQISEHSGTATHAIQAMAEVQQPIQNAGFEDGIWGDWQTFGYPMLVTDNVNSGYFAAYMGGSDYADDQVWQTVDIPADAEAITMEVMYNLSTSEIMSGSDYFFFYISDPISGTPYVARYVDFGLSGNVDWTHEVYALNADELASIAGKTVSFGFKVGTNDSYPSEAWVDDSALYIQTPNGGFVPESKVWQAVTLPAEGKTMALRFWLYADSGHDINDRFYVRMYDSSFVTKLLEYESPYTPGQWRQKFYPLVVPANLAGQVINLAFVVENDDTEPHSAFWIDDVELRVCPEAPYITNSYLRVDIQPEKGQYVVGTTGGDPSTANDDNKRLIFGSNPDGYSWPWTSFDTLRVVSATVPMDSALDMISPLETPYVKDNTLVTKWWVKSFEVTQTISLVNSPFSGRADTAYIHYDITNRGLGELEVGLRSVLDVKIGDNDGAPYFVPGYGNLTNETDFVGEQVPHYWKAFESATFDPAYLKGQGILDGGDAVRPNRFLIARWQELYNTMWDYTVDSGAVVTADSAVALYWTPKMLFPGETIELATYYGLGSGGGGSTWLDAPTEVTCDALDFQVVLWVNNSQSSSLTGGISTLTLPSGLSLAGDTITKTWPTVAPGEAKSVNWWVAASGDQAQTLTLAASTDFSSGSTLTPSSIQIKTPRCEAAPLKPPAQVQAAPGKTSIGLTWEPSESLEVSGYNIYRSTQASSGFVKISNVPVQATTYEDKDPTLTKTVPAYYYYLTSLAGSSESEASNTASATFGEIKLFIPNAYGPRNTTAIVPINIANADGLQIASQDVYINYPADILQVAGISRTVLTLDGGYAYDFNITQPGTVRIALASGTSGQPLHGEGTLFQVRFSVIGNEGLSGNMSFKAPPDTAIYSPDDLVNPIPLTLQGSSFRVQKNYILGDLSGDGAVKSNDAALALRVAVGKLMPTPEQRSAGDVNGDQRINSADVALIMRMAVGLNPLPTAAEQASALALHGRQVIMSIPNQSGSQGGTIKIPVNLSDAAQVAGSDLVVNYDPNLLEAKGASLGGLTTGKNFVLETNTATPGVLRVSLAQSQGSGTPGLPAGAGQLIELEFFVKRNAPNATTDLTISGARLNDPFSRDFATSALEVTINTTNGRVAIGGGGPAANSVYLPLLLKNIN